VWASGGKLQSRRSNKQAGKPTSALQRLVLPHISAPRRRELLLAGMDSLLIATAYDPWPLVAASLRYLKPSAGFAIFSTDVLTLTETFKRLKFMGVATNVQMHECWMREYQVAPLRTHPHMIMHAASGFIVTGYALENPYTVAAPVPRAAAAAAAAATSTAASDAAAPVPGGAAQ
jgi:hypothetical protein